MTVTLEAAYKAAKALRDPDQRVAAEAILLTYLDERMAAALQKAFDAEPAPDGPPIPKGDG